MVDVKESSIASLCYIGAWPTDTLAYSLKWFSILCPSSYSILGVALCGVIYDNTQFFC